MATWASAPGGRSSPWQPPMRWWARSASPTAPGRPDHPRESDVRRSRALGQDPQVPRSSKRPIKDEQELGIVDQVTAGQPPRFLEKPEEPFQSRPRHPARRAALTGHEVERGPYADPHLV